MLQGVALTRRMRQGTLGIIFRLTTCVPMFFLQGVICRHALALIHPAPVFARCATPRQARRGSVSCKCEGGHPRAYARGWKRLSPLGGSKFGTLRVREYTHRAEWRASFEPPWRRQLFSAHGVSRGGNHVGASRHATPPRAGWIHAKAADGPRRGAPLAAR